MKNVVFVLLSENIVKSKYISIILGIIFILPGVVFSLSGGMSCSDNPEIFSADWYGHLFITGMNLTEALGILLLINGLHRKNKDVNYASLSTKSPKLPALPKQTSTFWICLTIFICSLFVGLCIYQANRYETYRGYIIDKYNHKVIKTTKE